MVRVLPGRKLGPCCLSFLFSTDLQLLLNSGGSNSPWSEFWSCDPECLLQGPEPQKCPKWLGEGAKGVLDQWRQSPLALCKRELHRCKTGFRWCKRLLGDLCSLTPKTHLLHPLLTTLGNFEVRGPVAGTPGSEFWSEFPHPEGPNLEKINLA